MSFSRSNTNRPLYSGNTNQGTIPVNNPPVFSTPSQIEQAEQSSNCNQENSSQDAVTYAYSTNQMEALVTRYYYHQALDKEHEQMKQEEHDKRLKSLRKELDWISSTQWMYTSIDKLIGQ